MRVEAQGSAVELPVGESIAALWASRVAHEVACRNDRRRHAVAASRTDGTPDHQSSSSPWTGRPSDRNSSLQALHSWVA